MSSQPAPAHSAQHLPVRWIQLARAGIAALAALMITFSPDHSAVLGLAVFSGFAIATGLFLGLAAWLTYPSGRRWAAILMAIVSILIGTAASVPTWRNVAVFFSLVIAWAALTGLIELLFGVRERRRIRAEGEDASEARDSLTVGILGLVLAAVLPLVPMQYALDYYIEDAGAWFTLTGITIAVGVFGAYAAIVAVFLAIAGLSPRRAKADPPQILHETNTEGTG